LISSPGPIASNDIGQISDAPAPSSSSAGTPSLGNDVSWPPTSLADRSLLGGIVRLPTPEESPIARCLGESRGCKLCRSTDHQFGGLGRTAACNTGLRRRSVGADAERVRRSHPRSWLERAQTGGFIPPTVATESPAAASFAWSDLTRPVGQLAPKIAYRFGRSSPTLAAGVAGGVIGGAIGTPAGPEGTAAGALIGGSLGAAALSAAQSLGPAYAAELQKAPNDPEGAWRRAWEQAAISGAFSGAAWAPFPARFFEGPVRQLVFQSFGVQPAVAVAEKATCNIVEGKPAQEGL
jgi:hypothetical protein